MEIKRFKSISDIKNNIDEFPHKKKILIVTGLSGSGKSYLSKKIAEKYGAEIFQPEWLIHSKHASPTGKEFLNGFLDIHPEIKDLVQNKWNNCKVEDENQLLKKYINLFFRYFLENKSSEKLYIVEGLQIFTLIDFDLFCSFPIIIKGTSSLKSLQNRLKRDMTNHKFESRRKKISYFFKILKQSRLYQFKHRKKINRFIEKLCINK